MKNTLYKVIKKESNIKGYWKDKNKVYIDNIQLVDCSNNDILRDKKQSLFDNGELAVLYTNNREGIIESKEGQKTILNNRLEFKEKSGYNNIQKIKDIVNQYGGCTVFKKRGYILIEVWTNKVI